MTLEAISSSQARRIALAAQGFNGPRQSSVTRRRLARTLRKLGLFQIDSVNVVTRAHYMPMFSRNGPYPTRLIDGSTSRAPRLGFEYWAHEASLLPVETHPLLRWRMDDAREGRGIYRKLAQFAAEKRSFIDGVLAEVERRGPLTPSDIDGHRPSLGWWGWSEVKLALEWLFWAGLVTVHSRGPNFERRYDIPERVIPARIRAIPTPKPHEAQRQLLETAGRAIGIATRGDLRDYFRLKPNVAYSSIDELVEDGKLIPVQVEGWGQPALLHREARIPRRVDAAALLAPFDPLIWERSRVERLFGFRYRLEIYTPAEKREHGYYVFPFLLGEQLVARVDLKADRKPRVLRVHGTSAEDGAPPNTAERLAEALYSMAQWLGLDRVAVEASGDPFSRRLKSAVEMASVSK